MSKRQPVYQPGWLRGERQRYPTAGITTTKECSMAWKKMSACMNEKVRDDVETVAANIARTLMGTMQLPDWTVATAALHFVEDEQDRDAILRTCTLCQSYIPESQNVHHLVSVQPGYRVKFTYNYRSKNPIFLFPHDADIHPLMQNTEEYRLLSEYADNWYEADRRATHFKSLALYLAHACTSLNQLRTVWPEFDTVFAKPEYVGQYEGATAWAERFRKASVGKLPDLFPGFQAEIAEAQRTIGMYLMLDKPEQSVTNWTCLRSSPLVGPIVPWWDHVDERLYTTVPKEYRWCL